MATITGLDIACNANAAATAGLFATIGTNGLVSTQTSAGAMCIGVFTTSPSASGDACTVRYAGVTSVTAGATIDEGYQISSFSDGKGRQASAGHYIMGIALTPAASGESFTALMMNQQKNA